VITPSSLRENWLEAFKKWATMAVDPWKVRLINSAKDLTQKNLVSVISYTLATNLVDRLTEKNFQVIIAVTLSCFLFGTK